MIELLLVVVLLSAIAGVAVPNFSQTYKRVVFRKSVDDLVYAMRYAQGRAVTKRRMHQLQFDAQHSKYWIAQRTKDSTEDKPVFEPIASRRGRMMAVPEGVRVEGSHPTINFYPDGKIEKVRIYMTLEEQTFTISSMEQRGQVHLLDFKLEGS